MFLLNTKRKIDNSDETVALLATTRFVLGLGLSKMRSSRHHKNVEFYIIFLIRTHKLSHHETDILYFFQVEAFATRMTVTFQHPGVCADATGVKKRCINSDMPVTYNCVSEEGNGKYRLKRINGG